MVKVEYWLESSNLDGFGQVELTAPKKMAGI